MKRIIACLSVFAFVFVGCAKKTTENQSSAKEEVARAVAEVAQASGKKVSENQFNSFLIYADKGSANNHYIPSGFMPDGKCLTINDAWTQNCHAGKSCIKIIYDIPCSKEGAKWAGVYWQNPANNWGNRKGGFDLTGATKLTFFAKGEKGGERIEEFKIGGVTGDYPDSDTAVIGPVILTNEWKEYSIDLRGKDLSYISGGFAWSSNVDVNQEGCTFYLDDLKYE